MNSEKRALKQQIKERERQTAYEAHLKKMDKEKEQAANAEKVQEKKE